MPWPLIIGGATFAPVHSEYRRKARLIIRRLLQLTMLLQVGKLRIARRLTRHLLLASNALWVCSWQRSGYFNSNPNLDYAPDHHLARYAIGPELGRYFYVTEEKAGEPDGFKLRRIDVGGRKTRALAYALQYCLSPWAAFSISRQREWGIHQLCGRGLGDWRLALASSLPLFAGAPVCRDQPLNSLTDLDFAK